MRESLQKPARDRFLDVVRALAILAVVVQHWLMPVLSYSDGHLATGNALATPGWWILTWLSQVMPLVFFAGGAANLYSLRSAPSTRDWLAARVRRLLVPVLPLIAAWLLLPGLLSELGVAEQPLQVAGSIAAQLLWFLAVYFVTVLVTPLMVAAHRRWGLKVPVVFGVLALLIDVARFNDFGLLGYANALFIWLAVHQLGFHYVDGKLGTLGRNKALALSAAGFGITALMVAFGPYPGSMIGMPGAPVSNMGPPTALLGFVALGQIGLLLAAKGALNRVAARPPVAAALRWIGPRFMTVYLWHMQALTVVAGITVLGLGYETPEPGSTLWFAMAPMWFVLAALVLSALLRVFGRFETRAPGGTVTAPIWQLSVAALLASGGMLGLAANGFAPPAGTGLFGGPLPWVALTAGAYLLSGKRLPELRVRPVLAQRVKA
ncbi:acyltransferase family protein [Amycolatopsis sp. CA-230715]|uniref:acyltransferase family protein n=1 Tax=Amycolatopsis sp. CA-230715 TaxID=2745196 RepID=UPI001C00DFC2|nr:acyltransferase [Amycolatopsis sp. CA-230715]QWF79025.1 hypothetical protein HUW46_02427 [Amycolatopsis sp. CA-230715]